MRRALPFVLLSLVAGCFCMKHRFPDAEAARPSLQQQTTAMGDRCKAWFVAECEAGGRRYAWLFAPRIEGDPRVATYDVQSGELLFAREFGEANVGFAPVRLYGDPPPCKPELNSRGSESLCTWMERVSPAAPGAPASPAAPTATAPPPGTPAATATPVPPGTPEATATPPTGIEL